MRFYFHMLLFVVAALATAQQALNNEAIVKMVKAGLAEELIVSTIQSQPGSYSLGADDLIALKSAGVSDKILAAMVAKSTAGTTSPAPAAKEDPPVEAPVKEVGVYYKKGGEWVCQDVLKPSTETHSIRPTNSPFASLSGSVKTS